MAQRISDIRVQTTCLLTLTCLAVGVAFHLLQDVLVPFALAIMLAVPLRMVMIWLERNLRAPAWLALILTMVLGVGCIGLFATLIGRAIYEVSQSAGDYEEKLHDLAAQMLPYLPKGESVQGLLDKASTFAAGALVDLFKSLSSVASSFLLVLIYLILLLAGVRADTPTWSRTWEEASQTIRQYLGSKVVLSLVTGSLVGLTLRILQVDLAFVFGMSAFLLNFIPNIGSVIATLLPLPVVIGSDHLTTTETVLAILIPSLIQFGIGNLLEPRMLADGMRLHPVVMLLALMLWGAIWGPVGMLLAVPLTSVIRLLLSRLEITEPVARLLEGNTRPPADTNP